MPFDKLHRRFEKPFKWLTKTFSICCTSNKIQRRSYKNVTLCLLSAAHRGWGKAAEAVDSRSAPSLLSAHHPLSGTWAWAVTGSLRATWPSGWGLSGQKAGFVIWTKEEVRDEPETLNSSRLNDMVLDIWRAIAKLKPCYLEFMRRYN